MRAFVLTTCLVSGAFGIAMADTAAPPAAPAAAATTTAAAAPAPADSAAAQAEAAAKETRLEKHLLSEGYKAETHGGQKLFCKTEEVLGSRLGGQKYCSTAQQLETRELTSKEYVEQTQRMQAIPKGN